MVETNIKIITDLKAFLQLSYTDTDLKSCFVEKRTDFVRDRILTYQRTIFIVLNMLKKSISIELENFFENCISGNCICTKSAFTLQRKKLKPLFFRVWNELLVLCFYNYYESTLKKWNDFILIAVDGSTANLMNKESVKLHFGTHGIHFSEVPMAGIMKFYDVLNKITIFSKIYPITIGEKNVVADNIEKIPVNSLSIYDRGFPSFSLMYLLINQESTRHFVMRAKQTFNKEVSEFMKSSSKDVTIKIAPNPRAIHKMKEYGFIVSKNTFISIRMIKVVLDNGEIEVLLTNLYDKEVYEKESFKALYFLRWGIETSYGHDKNVLQMEQFSGHTVTSIEQDFYALNFLSNLQSIIEKQCETYVEIKNSSRKLKYKINKSVSTGYMKNKIIQLFLDDNPKEILLKLRKLFQMNLEPTRLERNYARRKSKIKSNGKFRNLTNYKRVL